MRLLIDRLLLSAELNIDKATTIIIENPKAFRMVIKDLIEQENGQGGLLRIVEGDKELCLSKSAILVLNPYLADLNFRKFLQLAYSELQAMTGEFPEDQAVVLSAMTGYLSKICDQSRFDFLEFSAIPDWASVFKAWGLRFEQAIPGLLPSLIQYLQLAATFPQFKLIIFINLKQYLLPEEQFELFKMAEYLQLKVLLVESAQNYKSDREDLIIIDKDLCEIQS